MNNKVEIKGTRMVNGHQIFAVFVGDKFWGGIGRNGT